VTTETRAAQSVLSTPTGGAVFYSGEALYRGRDMGTVEAALASGLATARHGQSFAARLSSPRGPNTSGVPENQPFTLGRSATLTSPSWLVNVSVRSAL
jgi:hypothetical protein